MTTLRQIAWMALVQGVLFAACLTVGRVVVREQARIEEPAPGPVMAHRWAAMEEWERKRMAEAIIRIRAGE